MLPRKANASPSPSPRLRLSLVKVRVLVKEEVAKPAALKLAARLNRSFWVFALVLPLPAIKPGYATSIAVAGNFVHARGLV